VYVGVFKTLVRDGPNRNSRRNSGWSNVGESDLGGSIWRRCISSVAVTPRVDCDFQARGSSPEEVMQLCADHGAQEHNMKGFGPELYRKMRSCVKTLEEGTSGPTS
jgi:predicted small metal-binding protein